MTPSVQLLPRETYLAMIRNAVHSQQYRNCYALVDGKKKDITQDGKTSCAFFASSVLHRFGLIQKPHITVPGTERDLVESGWKRIHKPILGCIIFWEMKKNNDEQHGHIGFFVGTRKAISTSSSKGVVALHHWTFGTTKGKPKRKIVAMYGHPFLISKPASDSSTRVKQNAP